ncbi:MAG TPA: hypothetical protein VF173_21640 [Thermoanaerobaculia bacterium]|nr:hypothetical protein [Thermoanaerobaculia bacterium]
MVSTLRTKLQVPFADLRHPRVDLLILQAGLEGIRSKVWILSFSVRLLQTSVRVVWSKLQVLRSRIGISLNSAQVTQADTIRAK